MNRTEEEGTPAPSTSAPEEQIANPIVPADTKRTLELASKFHRLFAGMERAHGTYTNVNQVREDGKRTGTAVTVRRPVTDELWRKHLAGESGIGIIPIRDDNTVVFGAIDIDAYGDFNPASLAAEVARLKLPLVVCVSKSGGAHAYCFTSAPVPASMMRATLQAIAALLGHGGSECFPKQGSILSESGDLGSWINAPYADADHTTRYALRPNGDAMNADAFLEYAEGLKVGPDFFSKPLVAEDVPPEFKDGPPCLATLVQIGFPEGSRNNGAYNAAVFLKRRFPDEWEKRLHDFNESHMAPNLSYGEVQQVIQSFKKGKDYKYRCSDSPIAQHCNPGLCRTRKYGVGGGQMPDFGPLAQQEGDTILWFWSIGGKRVKLTTPELFRFQKFQERCAEELRMVIPGMKQKDWEAVISRAMETCEPIPATEDATKAGALWELVEAFCAGPGSVSMADMQNGRGLPYHREDGLSCFKLSALMDFLQRRQFREMTRGEVSGVLKQHGGQAHKDNVGQGDGRTTRRYWSVRTPPKPAPLDLPPEDAEDRPAF
jgi:hypothetical protein